MYNIIQGILLKVQKIQVIFLSFTLEQVNLKELLSYSHKVTNYMSAPYGFPDVKKAFPPHPQPLTEWRLSLLYQNNVETYQTKLNEQEKIQEQIQIPQTIINSGLKFKSEIQLEMMEEVEEIKLFEVDSDEE